MSIIFAYIFYFIAASISPLQRRWLALKKPSTSKDQIFFSFAVTLVTLPLSFLLIFFDPFVVKGDLVTIILLSSVCGVFGTLTYVLNYSAQKHVDAGVTSVVSNIYTPVTIILSSLFIAEKLTNMQIVGTVILLVAMVIVSKKHHIGKFKFDKYFLMMLLSGVTLAVLLVTERYLQKTTGFTAGTMFSWWTTCLFLGIATLLSKSKNIYSKKEIITTGGFRFLQNLSWVVLVFTVGNLSIVSSITTFKVVIVFIAAAIFLKEREDLPRKIIGSIIAVVGLLLMK